MNTDFTTLLLPLLSRRQRENGLSISALVLSQQGHRQMELDEKPYLKNGFHFQVGERLYWNLAVMNI